MEASEAAKQLEEAREEVINAMRMVDDLVEPETGPAGMGLVASEAHQYGTDVIDAGQAILEAAADLQEAEDNQEEEDE